MTARYVHGSNAGADDPLVWYGNGTIYWLHSDHQGSITAIANIDGNLMWLNAYDEYGIPRAGNVGRFQYTGQAWLGDLGMYYYKARIYSPTLGRFLQTDPVGYQDQFNLYAYVGNDPMNRTDPSGMLERVGDTPESCIGSTGPGRCRDSILPPRAIRLELERRVPRPRREEETGGQAHRDRRTGDISYRTGAAAGRGTAEAFAHNPPPEGKTTIMRSHAHLRNAPPSHSAAYATGRNGNNGPGRDDLRVMRTQGIPVQTIGPDVTTTAFRRNDQDYLVVDSGDRSKIPNIRGIIVLEEDPE